MKLVEKFKQKRNLSKFLIGGQIPKLQTAWLPLYTELQRAGLEWGRLNIARTAELVINAVKQADEKLDLESKTKKELKEKELKKLEEVKNSKRYKLLTSSRLINLGINYKNDLFKKSILDPNITIVREAVKQADIKHDAIQRANRRTKPPKYNKTAQLLDSLYRLGMFADVKDYKGNEVTYNTAVDGIRGRMTDAAIEAAKKSGYIVNIDKGTVTKPKPETTKPDKKSSTKEYKGDSPNKNLQAIFDHKKRFNVTLPYSVIDKDAKTLTVYRQDTPLITLPITIGKNKGDGMLAPTTRGYPNVPMTTGAGIFIVDARPTSPYTRNEPMFIMMPDESGKYGQAVHSPANYTNRIAPFRNPNLSKRISSGCASCDTGKTTELYNSKLIQDKDSMYVLPEDDLNAIIERNAQLLMNWGPNNPATYVARSGKVMPFHYNNRK